MNKLPLEKRVQILSMLCEGSSMRSISRVCDVSINTVSKLLVDAGKACDAFHDANVRNVKARRVQVDEIWSFTCAKQKNVANHESARIDGAGDTWTWTAIEADTKLLISYLVGGRDSDYAIAFMDDLRDGGEPRATHQRRPQSLSRSRRGAFGGDVDYAQLVKLYGAAPESAKGRYSPRNALGRKQPVEGSPDPKHISTSFAERQNLTMRMQMRRFTRLTNAFSKKFENHMHMLRCTRFTLERATIPHPDRKPARARGGHANPAADRRRCLRHDDHRPDLQPDRRPAPVVMRPAGAGGLLRIIRAPP